MKKESESELLVKWSNEERKKVEDEIVASMFNAGLKTSPGINEFSTWLLVGSVAIGAFMISNADKLIPIISRTIFLVCGLVICLSCMFGLVSRIYALLCRIGMEVIDSVPRFLEKNLAEYKKIEDEIQISARESGNEVSTRIRLERINVEYLKPMPFWIKQTIKKRQSEISKNKLSNYFFLVKRYNYQLGFAVLQAVFFLVFMIVGIIGASFS